MSKKYLLFIVLFVSLVAAAVFSVAALAGNPAATPTDAATITDAATGTDGKEIRSFWDTVPGDGPVYAAAPMPVIGDLDGSGDLEPADARLALRYAVGLTQELEPDLNQHIVLWRVDRDGDGAATPADARLILRAAVGLDGYRLPDAAWGVYRLRTSGLDYEYDKLGALKPLEANADRVTNRFVKDVHLPLWRVDSAEALEQWIRAFRQAEHEQELRFSDWEMRVEPVDAKVLAFLERYNEAFFAENDLLICYKEEGSGSYLQTVYRPTVKDGALTLTVCSAWQTDSGGTADLGCWLVFTPVAKEVTAACRSFDCRMGEPVLFNELPPVVLEGKLNEWAHVYSLLLTEDTAVTLQKGNNPFVFSLKNAQDGGYLWTYEAEEGTSLREWFVKYPDDTAVGAPSLQQYTFVPEKPGTYTFRFRLKRSWETEALRELTVTLTVAEAPSRARTETPGAEQNGVTFVTFGPFDRERFFSPEDSKGNVYHACTFRGVIREIRSFQTEWRDENGEPRGPFDRALLTVDVTDDLCGAEGKETVTLLYPDGAFRYEGVPYGVEEGKEYWFLNCWLLDETYFANAGRLSPDGVSDPALRMADAITGHAARSFLPVEGGVCTVFREFFTEAQLADSAGAITPIPNSQYVTADAGWTRAFLADRFR